ncbi:MAG TPA: carbon-nitrogen hydrolase family protein [Microvirga sp.]|jgi:predicted amidohydrolase
MRRDIAAAVLQLPTSLDISKNLKVLLEAIDALERHTLLVAPEGALSGYSQDSTYLDRIDVRELNEAIEVLRQRTELRSIHAVIGSAEWSEGRWYNSSFYFGPSRESHRYRKINLAMSERGFFTPGDTLPVFGITVNGTDIRLGIQMCREIRYPEQWRQLAAQGAQIIAFLNNAVGDASICPVWRSHLVSRAAETQRFILAANNAEAGQKCPTMIVSSSGQVLFEEISDQVVLGRATIDLSLVSDYIISQARSDVVKVAAA